MENVEFQIMVDGNNYNPRTHSVCVYEENKTQKQINKELNDAISKFETNYQVKVSDELLTKNKELVKAINEIFNRKKSNVDTINFNKVAHRGFSIHVPENTLESYIIAKDRGFTFVETDIQITSDGHFVLFHDESVDRITNGTGKLRDKTLSEVRSLVIDGGNGADIYPNLKIATLDEFLNLCKQLSLIPVMELTPTITWNSSQVKNFLSIIEKYNMTQNVVLIAFDKNSLELIRNENDYIPLHYLADITEENLTVCSNLKNAFISCSLDQVSDDKINLAKSKGIKIGVWVVNQYNKFLELKEKGVTNITTDTI